MATTKLILKIDYEYDFSLIGICCPARDYRICWEINKHLGFNLEKENDIDLVSSKNKNLTHFSKFSFYDEDKRIKYYLLSNKNAGNFVLPEHKKADFILMSDAIISEGEIAELIILLKKIPPVQLVYSIEVEQLKSKQNLLF